MKNSKSELWLRYVCQERTPRDRELLRRALEVLENNTVSEGCPWAPLRGIVPSMAKYQGVWNWDCAFHAVAVGRWDPELAYEQCRLFWDSQLDSGMFLDVRYIHGGTGAECSKPPVFPWAFERVYRACPNREYLERGYAAYVKNEAFWCEHRKKDGLFFYSCELEPIEEEFARFESGWDDSVRFDDGILNLWPIDLNCYMIMAYRALQFMARELGLPEDCGRWQRKEQELERLVCERLWDQEQGSFCDAYFENNTPSKVLSPASFMPLYVGIASHEQAVAMRDIYREHFRPGMPIVSYRHDCYESDRYWRGPTWLNVSYFALKGLKNYGYVAEAQEAREQILTWCYEEKRGIFEYYDSKNGKGLGAVSYGWSADFIIEFVLNF